MSSLNVREKRTLEDLFGMSSGYVLDFSNRTFEEFITDVVGLDIYSPKYDYASGSKANRLRQFWTVEDDDVVATVLEELVAWAEEDENADARLIGRAWDIVRRLQRSAKPPAVVPNRPVPDRDPEGYQVALSFAGEQRDYVREVADILKAADVVVFYDEDEDLWGKDLVVEFAEVYGKRSRYIVIFVSEEYVKKAWTRHERQHALAGRLERGDDSVLPARFDDTELPGLPPTVGYLDLRHKTPKELASRILRKVKERGG
jgi:hypothetical protein